MEDFEILREMDWARSCGKMIYLRPPKAEPNVLAV